MTGLGYLGDVVAIMAVAVVAVSLSVRLRAGPVVGYLAAGILLGPGGLGLVGSLSGTRALAELGVVFLMFSLGLELTVERLRLLRLRLFALGLAQVLVTGLVLGGAAFLAGFTPLAAAAAGAGLALSSTAVGMRVLSDRRELNTRFGRVAFAILLVQDLAVGPLLVLVPMLGQGPVGAALAVSAAKVVVLAVVIVVAGRYLVRPLYRLVARTGSGEVMTAVSLLVGLVCSLAAFKAGLTMALGGLAAGLILAETEYRHQVAADIEPFRGLLLGLFFITVGMTVDPRLLWAAAGQVVPLVAGLVVAKSLLTAGLGRLFGLPWPRAMRVGLVLAQGGEFAFILFGLAVDIGLMPGIKAQLLTQAVTLSIAATPLLARLGHGLAERPRLRAAREAADEIAAGVGELAGHVLIAGYGRVGRTVAWLLHSQGIPFMALDLDAERVAQARARGRPVYYGDASRAEILLAAHAETAKAVVVALDDTAASDQIVALLHYIFPSMPIFVRARDRLHAQELHRAGADYVVPELLESGLQLGLGVLRAVDASAAEAANVWVERIRRVDSSEVEDWAG